MSYVFALVFVVVACVLFFARLAALRFIEKQKNSFCFCGEGAAGPDGVVCAKCGRGICEQCGIYDAEPLCPACYVRTRIGGEIYVGQD